MSKTRSEAERLLNTIVSSRVRLNALQGDGSASVEPSLEEEREHLPDLEKTIENHANIPTQEEHLFSDLPVDDELTEFEEPPLVLGIDPEPEIENQALFNAHPEDAKPDDSLLTPDLDPARPHPTVAPETRHPSNGFSSWTGGRCETSPL